MPGTGSLRRLSSPIFVGRDDELGRLDAALRAAADGRGGFVLVAGEAGIGKTRLLTEWLGRLPADVTWSIGGCLDIDEGILPYVPFLEIVRDLAGRQPQGSAAVDRRIPASTSLAELLAVRPSAAAHGSDAARLFAAVAARLQTATVAGPAVIVIEDGQWLDIGSVQLLRYLVRSEAAARCLVVVTLRTDSDVRPEAMAMFAERSRTGDLDRIDLGRFEPDDLAAQVAAIVGATPDPSTVARVQAWSGGNPFFTEEVLALDLTDGKVMPAGFREMLLARISTAPPDVQVILGAAAVGGRSVRDDDLAAVVGATMDPERWHAALRRAIAMDLVVRDPDVPDADLAFRHALVREALVSDLLPGERRGWHATWAGALEERAPERAAAIAEHWDRAGQSARAVRAYLAAAEAAIATFARADAGRCYRRAADLVTADEPAGGSPGPGQPDRVDLLEQAALELEFAGERDAAIETLRAAIADAAAGDDRARTMRLQRRISEISGQRAHGSLSWQAILEAMTEVGDDPDAEGAAVLAAYAMRLGLRGDLGGARSAADRALVAARKVGAPIAEARASQVLAQLSAMDDVESGIRGLRETAAMAAAAGDVDVRMEALADLSWAFANGGRYAEALAAIEEANATAERLGTAGELRPLYLARRLEYLFLLGRWAEAEAIVQAIEASPAWTARFRAAVLRTHQGRLDDAARLIDEALARRPIDDPDIPDRGGVAIALAELALARRDSAGVIAVVDPALPLPGETSMAAQLLGLGTRASEVAADRSARDADRVRWIEEAHRFSDALLALEQEGGAGLPIIRAQAGEAAAIVARLDGADDVARWRAVADGWLDLGVPERRARAMASEVESILGGGGRRATATARFVEAYEIATSLGAGPLLDDLRDLARRSRIRIEDDPAAHPDRRPVEVALPGDPHGLSDREREILALVAAGRTNREIGTQLFISPKTVGVHVSSILGKLGVANRVEAAVVAQRLDLT